MKKFTLVILLFTVSSSVFTQINKGQFLLGGEIKFESNKQQYSFNPDNKSTNFFVSPSVGYFVVDKLAGGLRLNISSYNTNSDNNKTHITNTIVSPFVRYYLLPLPNKVNAFIDVSYIHGKTHFDYYGSKSRTKETGYDVSAGPAIFVTKHVAVEFKLGFKHTYGDEMGEVSSNTFYSSFGLQVHLPRLKNNKAI